MGSFTWLDELLVFVHGCIERVGWGLMHVSGEDDPSWTYTIGLLDRFDHPELIVLGLDPGSAEGVLNSLALEVASRRRFTDGEAAAVRGVDVRLSSVHENHWASDLFAKWHEYYAALGRSPDPAAALQVIWPDHLGHFPGDPGFDPRLDRFQRLLAYPHG